MLPGLAAACGGPGTAASGAACGCGTSAERDLADVVLDAFGAHAGSAWVKSPAGGGRRGSACSGPGALTRDEFEAVRDKDKGSMSSLMSGGGRSGQRARRTWIGHAPESRSRLIGPRKRLWPRCSSPSCPVRCQLSRADRQASNGMSAIRRNDSPAAAEHVSALGLALGSGGGWGGGACQQFWASTAGMLSQRRMREMRLVGPLCHRWDRYRLLTARPGRGRAGPSLPHGGAALPPLAGYGVQVAVW